MIMVLVGVGSRVHLFTSQREEYGQRVCATGSSADTANRRISKSYEPLEPCQLGIGPNIKLALREDVEGVSGESVKGVARNSPRAWIPYST